MNVFDFMTEKSDDYFSGTYYTRRPKTTEDKGIAFDYDLENDQTQEKGQILNSLEVHSERMSIKTVERLKFRINGFVVSQEGEMWQIESMLSRPYKAEKQAYRTWQTPPRKETVLRLIKVQNPWGLQ